MKTNRSSISIEKVRSKVRGLNTELQKEIIRGINPTGKPFGNRHTGWSTVLALRTIVMAIEHPNERIPVIDHQGTKQDDRFLLTTIANKVREMGLRHFAFGVGNDPFIRYEPYSDEPTGDRI